jgi:hypothetical protein
MGHHLHAVVGPKATILEFGSRWADAARVLELEQGFALVPLTEFLHDNIVELVDLKKPDPFPGFELLSASVEFALRDVSRLGPIAYIETDYIGGQGFQRAIAWKQGKLLVGPFLSESFWDETGVKTKPPGERGINRILTALGVWTRGTADPFEMIGLHKLRDTDRAFEKAGEQEKK